MPRKGSKKKDKENLESQELIQETASAPVEILSANGMENKNPNFAISKTNKFFMIVFNAFDVAKARIQKITDIKELQELRLFAYRKDKDKIVKAIDERLNTLKS